MTIQLRAEDGYVVCDTDEWLADRGEDHEEAQDAFDAYVRDHAGSYPMFVNHVLPWLRPLKATGMYGEDAPYSVSTVNVENYLNEDIIVTMANTETYGKLLIWSYGYMTTAQVHVWAFTGDDDSDAYDYTNGTAGHENCDCDWILQAATHLWSNAGHGNANLSALEQDDDCRMLCPDHGVPLEFWTD